MLTLLDGNGEVVAVNTGWGGTAALSAAFTQVGAFALLVTLPPGAYTVKLSGAVTTMGLGLLEIYDVR